MIILVVKQKIPKSSKITFAKQYTNILQSKFTEGFQYYDVQVDDKKLVEMNIDDAKKGRSNCRRYKSIKCQQNR